MLPLAPLAVLAPALAGAQDVPPGLPRLTGTVVGPAGRTATFEATANQPSTVEEGDRIAAYVVRLIRPNAVQVELNGRTYTIVPAPLAAAARPAPANAGGATFGLIVNPRAPAPD